MSVSEEKPAGVDQALDELGRSEEDIAELRGRVASAAAVDLEAVDAELGALSEGVSIEPPAARPDSIGVEVETWEDDSTEVEVLDESDFVLLVDEGDLEELEKVGEDDAKRTAPPEVPVEGEEEDDGFFKKLFGGRRSRPPQA